MSYEIKFYDTYGDHILTEKADTALDAEWKAERLLEQSEVWGESVIILHKGEEVAEGAAPDSDVTWTEAGQKLRYED